MTTLDKDLLTMNQRIKLAGIETIRLSERPEDIYLNYGDITILRPFNADQCPDYCLEHFGIEI
jgi:hypothetical protein